MTQAKMPVEPKKPKRPNRLWQGWLNLFKKSAADDNVKVAADKTESLISKRRHWEEEIDQGLSSIYRDNKGRLPDLGRLERRHTHGVLGFLWRLVLAAAVITAAVWTVSYLYQPLRDYVGPGLKLQLSGVSKLIMGQEETYQIRWTNNSDKILTSADIRLALPPDFVVTETTPAPGNDKLMLWHLDQVAPGADGTLSIKGVYVGAVGTASAIQAMGTYRVAGLDQDKETVVTQAVVATDSVLAGDLRAPLKVLSGDVVALEYAVTNNGQWPMKELLAKFEYPRGFLRQGAATGTGVLAEEYVPLADLAPGASTTARITGVFASGSSGDNLFSVQAGHRNNAGLFLPAQKSEVRVPVLAGDLNLNLVVNGATADRTMRPGEPLHLSLAYQNTSAESLKDAVLTIGFETFINGASATGTSLVDWRHLTDARHGTSSTRARVQTIGYAAGQIAELANLAPQADGRLELTVPTLSAASGTRDAAIRITAQGFVAAVGATKVSRLVQAQPLNFRYRSDASLAATANYFTEEGAPVGFGPLPPVAGTTTAYRVTWRLTKTLYPLSQVIVSAVLPKNTYWSGKVVTSTGIMGYDPASRAVRWTTDQLSDGPLTLETSFEIQLTPDQNDIGRFAGLLGESQLQALDPTVSESLSLTAPALNTDLQNDDGARGKGVVRKL